MRRVCLLASAAFVAACTADPIAARPVPDAKPSLSWSPDPREVALVADAAGGWRGTVRLRERDFEVAVDPGAAAGAPTIVVADCGDGTVGTLTGRADGDDLAVEGILRLLPDGRALHVELEAESASEPGAGAPPTLRVLVTECPAFDVDLGGRTFRVLLLDRDSDGRFDDLDTTYVVFDRDGDGQHDDEAEGYAASEPFDLGTGAVRVREAAADGSSVTFERSWRSPSVRPFVGKGDPAPPLPTAAIDGGAAIDLAALHGRRVLLLFWFPT